MAGDDLGTLLFDSSHDHAEVRGFDDDADAARLEEGIERIADLLSESFLDLEPAGIHVDDPWDFAEADRMFGRQITDMHFAHEGEEVMLAERVELDIFDDHHPLRVGIEDGRIGLEAPDVELCAVACGHLAPGLEEACGRIFETFARGILSEFFEEADDEVLVFFTRLFLTFPGEFHPLCCRDVEDAVFIFPLPIERIDALFVAFFVERHGTTRIENIVDEAVRLFRRVDNGEFFELVSRELGSDDRTALGDTKDTKGAILHSFFPFQEFRRELFASILKMLC